MLGFAIKMLLGDKAKFAGIVIGLTFASFIITQQSAIFVGLMQRTYGFLTDTSQPDIWVMEKEVQFVDDIKTIKMSKLFQVKSIQGVLWAEPLYKGLLKARLANGKFQICNVIGINKATLIGGPPKILQGQIENLHYPDGIIVNATGANKKLASLQADGSLEPLKMGDVLELNDQRAKVVGICQTTRSFQSQPVIYCTFQQALKYSPRERNLLSFIMVKVKPGVDPKDLVETIRKETDLAAYTSDDFKKLTLKYYLAQTGIPINFGTAVLLGFIIGAAIAGQTFYAYAHDNMKYFATFKAMGATRKVLIKMILIQALITASLGWSFGVGLAASFALVSRGSELSFSLPIWLFFLSLFSVFSMTFLAALHSLLKILRLEPSIVFQS